MTIKFDEFLNNQLQDSELAVLYNELEPQYQLVRDLLDLQETRNIGAPELAQVVGVAVDDLFYLEDAGGKLSFSLLFRLAQALNARLEIRLVPSEAPVAANARVHAWLLATV